MANESIEISVRGKWVPVPAVTVNGSTIIVQGKWIKTAVVHDEQWSESELVDPESCVQTLREQVPSSFRADIFTFAQKLPATEPKYKYPMEWESLAVARTSTFKEWWEKLPQETRKNVRRSQKRSVTVCVKELNDETIGDLVKLNNDSPMRQGKPNAHYGKTFDEVKKDYSSFLGRSDLIGAYFENELIGLVKLVYRGDVASILQCLPNARHHDKRPANALVAKAVELCEARGIAYLTYGMFRYGNKLENPLLEFKIRNGFEETLVPRYYVALTRWGSLCMATKLHRGVLGIVPHRVITLGVGARAKWYDLTSSSR